MTTLPVSATMADYQAYIKAICAERGWDKRTALEKMLFMTEEVGELAKAIRKEHGTYGYAKPDNTEHLSEELADVFNYIIDIANVYNIDLEKAFRDKWAKNATRSWDGDFGARQ